MVLLQQKARHTHDGLNRFWASSVSSAHCGLSTLILQNWKCPHAPPPPRSLGPRPRSGPVGRLLSSSYAGLQNRGFSVTRGSGLGDGRPQHGRTGAWQPVPPQCPVPGGRGGPPGSQLWPLITGPSFSRLFSLQVPVPPKLFLSLVYKLEGTSKVGVALELTTGDAGSCHIGGISALNGKGTRLAPACLPGLSLLMTLWGGEFQKVGVRGAGVGSAWHRLCQGWRRCGPAQGRGSALSLLLTVASRGRTPRGQGEARRPRRGLS